MLWSGIQIEFRDIDGKVEEWAIFGGSKQGGRDILVVIAFCEVQQMMGGVGVGVGATVDGLVGWIGFWGRRMSAWHVWFWRRMMGVRSFCDEFLYCTLIYGVMLSRCQVLMNAVLWF